MTRHVRSSAGESAKKLKRKTSSNSRPLASKMVRVRADLRARARRAGARAQEKLGEHWGSERGSEGARERLEEEGGRGGRVRASERADGRIAGWRVLQLGGQALLGYLVAHEHDLVGAKLDLRVLRVGATEQNGEVVLGRVGEECGQRPVKVADVLLEGVDGVREELEQQADHFRGGPEDAVVRPIVDGELVDFGHLHERVPGDVLGPEAAEGEVGALLLAEL